MVYVIAFFYFISMANLFAALLNLTNRAANHKVGIFCLVVGICGVIITYANVVVWHAR